MIQFVYLVPRSVSSLVLGSSALDGVYREISFSPNFSVLAI